MKHMALTVNMLALQVTANGQVRDVAICGPGRECSKGSVDYFTLDIERFGFSTSIEALKLKEDGKGGWRVQSIFVFIDTCETHELASSDANFNKWVDNTHIYITLCPV